MDPEEKKSEFGPKKGYMKSPEATLDTHQIAHK